MAKWDLFVRSPRWLEMSGLPRRLCADCGPAAWVVFKKLCEIDCERNLVPDWFSVSARDLAAWTGLQPGELGGVVSFLRAAGLVDTQKITGGWRARIQTPLPVPDDIAAVRLRLRAVGINAHGVRLRYYADGASAERFPRVLELYQSVFGTRMTSQIADELREIAENFEWAAIEEAFEDARGRKKTNFYSVLNRLYKEIYDEQVAENLRDASRPPLPSGYELT